MTMTKCNAILFSPASFCECFTNGCINITKYLAYCRKSDMLDEDINAIQKIINSSFTSKKKGNLMMLKRRSIAASALLNIIAFM